MGDIQKNSYSLGLDQDTSSTKYNPGKYYYLLNGNVMTNQGLSTGSITSEIGNALSFIFPPAGTLDNLNQSIWGGTTLTPIGAGNIRNELILFTVSGNKGQIWRANFDDNGNLLDGTDPLTANIITTLSVTYNLVYNGLLMFDTSYPIIDMIGRYTSPEIAKLYWGDNYNLLRHININDTVNYIPNPSATTLFNGVPSSRQINIPVSQLEIIADVIWGQIALTDIITGGGHKSGVIQYSYQLFNINGSETTFAPACNLIHLTDKSEDLYTTMLYNGAEKDKEVGKTLKVQITNIDTNFDYIRFVAIYYNELNSTPEINLVSETSISGTTMNFVDTGLIYNDTYTLQEFRTLGSTIFSNKTLAVKDNRLLAANLVETKWDIDYDARAYRFRRRGEFGMTSINSILYNSSTSSFYIWLDNDGKVNGSGTPWDVVKEHNCINTFNNPDTDIYSPSFMDYTCMYQNNGTTLGGTGLNIEYSFIYENIVIDQAMPGHTTPYVYDTTESYTDYASPFVDMIKRSHARDEVYRYGIVLYNKKGLESYVKWIGDIRFPGWTTYETGASTNPSDLHEHPIFDFYAGDNSLRGMATGVRFNVNNLPSGVIGYRIVRCERKAEDRSIQAMGMMERLIANSTTSSGKYRFAPPYYTGYPTEYGNTYLFNSPEINFNKNLIYRSGDYIQLIARMNTPTKFPVNNSLINLNRYWYKWYKPSEIFNHYGSTPESYIKRLLNGSNILDPYETISTNGFTINNYAKKAGNPGSDQGYGGTTLICSDTNSINALESDLLACYRRNVFLSQYGGPEYAARQTSEYIAVSNFVSSLIHLVDCFSGDTYIALYDYLNVFPDAGANHLYPGNNTNATKFVNQFPCETSINLELRHDSCDSKTQSFIGNNLFNFTDPENGMLAETVSKGVEIWGASYPALKATDLYLYNAVYSRSNNTKIYFPNPIIEITNTIHDYRIRISQEHNSDEKTDSWLKFYEADYKDVDGIYGEINKLQLYFDRIMFYQDNAVGIQSVNERSLTRDSQGVSLVLGTGDLLGKYGYITTTTGTIHQGSVILGDGVYHYDSKLKEYYKYNGQSIGSITDSAMFSWFKNNLTGSIISKSDVFNTNSSLKSGVSAIYDNQRNKVLFSFFTDSGQYTLSYNETMKAWESFHSFIPSLYFKANENVYSINPSISTQAYQHYTGNYNQYYENYYPLIVKTIINKNPDYVKTYNNVEWNTFVTNGTNEVDETFNEFKLSNDYQFIGINLGDNNLRKRMRTWRLQIPRADEINNIAGQQQQNRMKSQYALLELTYNPGLNRKMTLYDLTTHIDYVTPLL